MKYKRQVLTQFHGRGLCTCLQPCRLVTHGWLVVNDWGRHFWDANYPIGCARSDRALIATYHGRLVGVMKYGLSSGLLMANGTWVAPAMRRSGLAVHLWERVIEREHPTAVEVLVVSDRGKTLVHRLQRQWPGICWDVFDDGLRPLRLLKE